MGKITDAIVLAAGKSKRYSKKKYKQHEKISGNTLVSLSVEMFSVYKEIRNIYIVKRKEDIYRFNNSKKNLFYVNGGISRSKSVFNALKAIHKVTSRPNNVIIHDSARPIVKHADLKSLLSKSSGLTTGIGFGYPITNAIKKVKSNLMIEEDINRDKLYVTFTPQMFNFIKIHDAYKKIISAKVDIDDDLQAMRFDSHKVKILLSSPFNVKLTYESDLTDIIKVFKSI